MCGCRLALALNQQMTRIKEHSSYISKLIKFASVCIHVTDLLGQITFASADSNMFFVLREVLALDTAKCVDLGLLLH